jgi:hypothetical protein
MKQGLPSKWQLKKMVMWAYMLWADDVILTTVKLLDQMLDAHTSQLDPS